MDVVGAVEEWQGIGMSDLRAIHHRRHVGGLCLRAVLRGFVCEMQASQTHLLEHADSCDCCNVVLGDAQAQTWKLVSLYLHEVAE